MSRVLAFAAIALMIMTLAATAASVAGKPATGNNSPNAKACQKDGWMSFYRSDGIRFTSEGDCTSYAAKGGTLVTATATPTNTQVPPTATPDPRQVILSFEAYTQPGICLYDANVTGFVAGIHTVYFVRNDGGLFNSGTISVAADGTGFYSSFYFSHFVSPGTSTQLSIDGVLSDVKSAVC